MIQVKEFINYQANQNNAANEWLQEKGDTIEIVDIKYSVGALQTFNEEFSGILVVYKVKVN